MAILKQLRDFSIDRHDFPTLIRNSTALLRMLTLNVDSRYNKRISMVSYFIVTLSAMSYTYIFQVSTCWFIFFRDVENQRREKILAYAQWNICIVGIIKFLNVYWNKETLKEIVDAYLECDSKVAPHSRMSRNIDKTLRVVKKRAVVLWLTITINVSIYLIFLPLISIISHNKLILDDYAQIWGLQPISESPNYEKTVAMILTAVPIIIYGATHVTIFFMVVVGYTEAQMRALSEELLNLFEDAENDVHFLYKGLLPPNKTSVLVEEFIKHRLEAISKSHALNIHLIRRVESTFRYAIVFQLMCISMSIVGNLLAGLETTFSQIPLTMLLVGIDCYTGQNLIDASTAFEAAVYRCKWERFAKSNMKLVLIMLQSAQKTMKVSAGGVACLDYVSFMFIAKSIYQAYAALQSK